MTLRRRGSDFENIFKYSTCIMTAFLWEGSNKTTCLIFVERLIHVFYFDSCPLDQGSGSQNVLLVCPICLSFCLHIFLFLPLTFKLYNS